MTGTTPRGRGRVDRERHDVAARLDLGLAEREVDHVHAVARPRPRSRRRSRAAFSSRPKLGVGDRERLVVAEVRVRRDARDDAPAAGLRVVRCRRRFRRRACRGTTRSGRTARPAYVWSGAGGENARATITLALVNCVCPFGKPAGIAYPVGSKYLCVASMPSSMIPIFIPLPAVSSVGPQSLSAPIRARAAAVEERALCAHARSARPSRRPEPSRSRRHLARGQDDGEPVRDEPVAPAHARIRQIAASSVAHGSCSVAICAAARRCERRAAGEASVPTTSRRRSPASTTTGAVVATGAERENRDAREERGGRSSRLRRRRLRKAVEPCQSADERT